jgi:hypothetical protein
LETLGVLERADTIGLVANFPVVVKQLKASGFFIAEALEQQLLITGSFRLQTRRLNSQFFGGKFDYFALTPDVDRQALACMLDNHFLNGGLESHLGSLFQRQFENVSGWFGHGFP